jgi:hypothetical protein
MSNPNCPDLGQLYTGINATPQRYIDTVFLHCTASSNKEVDAVTVNQWHLDRGWNCIGYHYLITSDGDIEIGRDIELAPAAQQGYNTGSIAICLNGLVPNDFNQAQFDALVTLCDDIEDAISMLLRFRGHCEVAAKECPVFDYKKVLGLAETGYKTDSDARTREPFELTIARYTLSKGDQGTMVALAQGLLSAKSNLGPGPIDGIAGDKFDRSLRSFQKDNHLIVDGVLGASTWEVLEE